MSVKTNKKLRTPKDVEQIFSGLRLLIAISVALIFAFIVIFFISEDPVDSISSFIFGPFKTVRRVGEIVSKATPLLFTGAAVCFIFSANQTNMAVEGGFTVGALGATIAAVYFPISNPVLHILVCLVMGGLFGMIACAIPAFLYIKFNAKPIVSSLMTNYICMYFAVGLINHPMRDNESGFNASKKFAESSILPRLIPKTDIHLGVIIGLVIVAFAYFYLYRSKKGYEIRVVGQNADFAKYSGMPVKKIVWSSQLIGGFLAGMGGAVEMLGMYNRFQYAGNTGLGFDGIMVGIMSGYNPIFVVPSAFFYAYIKEGAAILARVTDIPIELVSIIQAIIMMLVVAERFLYKQKHKMMVQAAEEQLKAQNEAEKEAVAC